MQFFILGKMLMEHETTKLKEQEELYARELREWKAHLKPRKQVISMNVRIYYILYAKDSILSLTCIICNFLL